MAYQVLARKWRPQRFDDIVGQQVVTRTLRNALASGRIAHAFVFAGPRGVGKTTTARILARALNCEHGPTADPCGRCEACVEIAEGRDIDVLEIDAATHTGIDNVREVIISGLAISPVRNRYKIFIIDEVHQLSVPSFNALLKSIEEPPPHVVFMMATTALDKIPETVRSRAQVFEFRTIPANQIADQLRTIARAEAVAVSDAALALIARAAEGSMRDAQSALDQVIAFAGGEVSIDDVSTVLGLVGRDLLFEIVSAVAAEDASAPFTLAGRAVESGYDLRLVCRELARLVRDLLVLSIDPSRADDAEIAPEGEREALGALAGRFSREDLLRAFDVLTRAEAEIRASAHPRYNLEMALLRWMHVRKLVPLAELLGGGGSAPGVLRAASPAEARAPEIRRVAPPPAPGPRSTAPASAPAAPAAAARPTGAGPGNPGGSRAHAAPAGPAAGFKEAFLAEIQRVKAFFYGTVVAQAQRIEVEPDRITFTFSPAHRVMREQLEQSRAWLESVAETVAGRRVAVLGVQAAPDAPAASANGERASRGADLKAEAMADAGVQALLDVFPAEIRDVEET